MANLDYGRQQDLKQLAGAISEARSRDEREHYERMAYRILNESDRIKKLRYDLINASRAGDRRAMNRICERIQYIRQNETSGKSWGNLKGERSVN